MSDQVKYSNAASGAEVDAGLQAYMRGVFMQMGGGVALSGIVAVLLGTWGLANPTAFYSIFSGWQGLAIAFAPLLILIFVSFGFNRMSYGALQASFWVICGIKGVSFSLLAASALSNPAMMTAVANAFFGASAAFLGAALYGYTTKQDLTRFGGLFVMAIIGLLVVMVINIFLQSTMMHYIISGVGVLLFTAITAYDTQNLKMQYYATQGTEMARKLAVLGAINLYWNFILIFQFLLSFFQSD